MIFRPKRDRWLSILMWICMILIIVVGLAPMLDEDPHLGGIIATALICWGTATFIAWIWFDMRYQFGDDTLVIRSGPFVTRVPYEKIQSVRPIRSVLSSAAASIDRLEIRYGRFDEVHVSPLDREMFIQELERRCPNLKV